jgi:hypothetical protein
MVLYQSKKFPRSKGSNQWSEETSYRMREQVFLNHTSDKGLIFKRVRKTTPK